MLLDYRLKLAFGGVVVLLTAFGVSCSPDAPPHDGLWEVSTSKVRTESVNVISPTGQNQQFQRPILRDGFGRYVMVHGVNVSGSNKWPSSEDFKNLQLWKDDKRIVSYVDKPFPLDEADKHFGQLQSMGFNAIRLIMNWEAIMPYKAGEVDEEYLDYIEALVAKASEYGIYVLLDMHQDIFSRHLFVRYNMHPKDKSGKEYPRGSLESMVMGLVEPYDNWYRGDGFPRWVVEMCLPEKNLDSPNWGTPRLLSGLTLGDLMKLATVVSKFLPMGDDSGDLPEWAETFLSSLPPNFDVTETTDVLPWTMWGVNGALSLDIQRCFATFFAGDKIYPKYLVDGISIKDFLQENYILAFTSVAERVKDFDNVIGYDIINEPIGFFITMSAIAAWFDTGLDGAVSGLLKSLLGEETGEDVFELMIALRVLPPDLSDETREKWGFKDADLAAMIGLNIGFDANYLQPFLAKAGQAIQDVDTDAVIWFELSQGLGLLLGEGGTQQWAVNPKRLEGVRQQVYAPHWYPDIYPFLGINQPPREFSLDEFKYRDFEGNLQVLVDRASFSMGNVPVVFGEFGTYFNYGGIEASKDNKYVISTQILDRYYQAFENLNLPRMVWCWSPENTNEHGEGWDLEDFSIVDPDLKPRAQFAYVRPYARATSGQLVKSHFYSPYHYLEPEKGKPLPTGEFYLEMGSKETNAPTEVFVPDLQYPQGFYVTVSDGRCYFDSKRQMLHWYPSVDTPGINHWLRIDPPRPQVGAQVDDWDYFFEGGSVVEKGGL